MAKILWATPVLLQQGLVALTEARKEVDVINKSLAAEKARHNRLVLSFQITSIFAYTMLLVHFILHSLYVYYFFILFSSLSIHISYL